MENQDQNNETESVAQEITSENSGASENIESHKAVAVIGYILPIIFFVPLLSEDGKKNSFAMFHANQHLILLIAGVVLSFVNVIPFLGQLVWFFGAIALFTMAIMNLLAATKGEKKELPFIGGYKIL